MKSQKHQNKHFINKDNMKKYFFYKWFLINLIIITFAYGIYLCNIYYSNDYFNSVLYLKDVANTNLNNGRFVHYFIYSFFDRINFNILDCQVLTKPVLTLSVALGTTWLLASFTKIYRRNDMLHVCILDISLLLIFISPSFLSGWYLFPETCIGASISMMCTFIAIHFWCHEQLTWKNIILSLIFICLSVSMYQVYVELYVGICLTFSLLKYNFKFEKNSLKEVGLNLFCGGFACIITIVIMSFLQKLEVIPRVTRSATLSFDVIVSNIQKILMTQKNIWYNMSGYMPRYVFAVFILGLLIFIIFNLQKSGKQLFKPADYFYFIVNLCIVYVLAFAPNIISDDIYIVPRTYLGVFAFVFIIINYALYICTQITKGSSLYKPFLVYHTIALLITILYVHDIQADTLVSNRFDEYEIKTLARIMDSYEADTGVKIDSIVYTWDENRRYGYDNVKWYDYNIRGMAIPWCFPAMVKYWINPDIHIVEMTAEEYQSYFNGESWTHFNPTEQTKIIDSTLYLVIY